MKKNKEFLAIDLGTKKSGVAYSVSGFAFGWETVPTKGLLILIPRIMTEKHLDDVVLGLPYHIDGSLSPHGQRVLTFGKRLEEELGLTVHFFDERLTSSEAEIFFQENRISRERDTEAARLILEGFLEKTEL